MKFRPKRKHCSQLALLLWNIYSFNLKKQGSSISNLTFKNSQQFEEYVCQVYLVFCICNRNPKVLGENLSEKKKWVATSTKEFLGEKSPKLATYSKKKKKRKKKLPSLDYKALTSI